MSISKYAIAAKVHMPIGHGGYRVKVWFPDIGMYINGVLVFPPNEQHNRWGVLTPRFSNGGRGRQSKAIEFDGKSELWHEFTEAAIRAVKHYVKQRADVGLDDGHPEPDKAEEISF